MAERGHYIADENEVQAELFARLPTLKRHTSAQETAPLAAAMA
jgi:hypothetical protein